MRTTISVPMICLAVLLAVPMHASAQSLADGAVITTADAIRWQPAPAILPRGAQAAILAGDPGQPGVVAMRVRVPDGYRIAPHRHTVEEHVTVLSGTLCFSVGADPDAAERRCVGAGGFAMLPPGVAHSVTASGATEYHIQAAGPFVLRYLDPADDPTRRP